MLAVAGWAAAGCSDDSRVGTETDGGAPDAPTSLPRLPSPVDGPGPVVTEVQFPGNAAGDIVMELGVAGVRAAPVRVRVEVSRDAGATFQPATAEPVGAADPSRTDRLTMVWRSLTDLGFRTAGQVVLRFVAGDAQGDGSPALYAAPALDNLRAAAARVDHYIAGYGPWDAAAIAVAQRYQLAIVHTRQPSLTRNDVATIQHGANAVDTADDVIVLCYVSIGEDLRTAGVSDGELGADPRFRGDGSGPRVDPRGPNADGGPLVGIDPRGMPSGGGTGYASFYLDDNDGNGIPDRNARFGGLFVNAGDPAWFDTVDNMTLDGPDRVTGLREVLTANHGRGLDCDGVFMDTIDTAAPNSFTNPSSGNPSEFEWTAPGFAAFIRRVHEAYPDKLVLQNRGLFFYDPRHPHYQVNPRGAVDFVLFESYRLDSNASDEWNEFHYPDNRYNVAPKLMAEANRPDGFRVLSLGYAEGPPDRMSKDTLLGRSTLGLESLLEDIHVTQDLAGFRHYITDGQVELVNEFVRVSAVLDDHEPPQWTSTFNDQRTPIPVAPTPRVGIQEASGAGGQITVRWDVALDKHRVRYVLYAQPEPFDFAADPRLTRAHRVELSPTVPASYARGVGPTSYAHEATVGMFPAGQTQHLVIRAMDESPARNEDANTTVVTARP
jgi:hypothetical protein